MNTRFHFSIVAVILALAVSTGCDNPESHSATDKSATNQQSAEQQNSEKQSPSDQTDDDSNKETAEQTDLVNVPEQGKKFDPSVDASQIPGGAWHCNMNDKVHYAAMKKGNGECPVCGMKLKQK